MIELRADAAADLLRAMTSGVTAKPGPETRRLLKTASDMGVTLEAVHPGQTHPLLVSHFMVDAPDRRTAEELVKRLQQMPIVEGVYLAPEAQSP